MSAAARILIIGTADTKADELLFMQRCVREQGGEADIMDVGVLGKPPFEPAWRNSDVAAAAGTTLEAIIALGDENAAMTQMAAGAVALALTCTRPARCTACWRSAARWAPIWRST